MAMSPAGFNLRRVRRTVGDDDKENCFDASPVLVRRKSGRRNVGLSDLQSPPVQFPSKELEYVGDVETTPVPQEKFRKRKLSLNRRVSFAEKTTIHEFTRDEEYRTPPKGKHMLSKETEEITDSSGKLAVEGDPIPRAEDDSTAPLLKRQKERQSILILSSVTPHGGIQGDEMHPQSGAGKDKYGSPWPSGTKEAELDGVNQLNSFCQENESAIKQRKDLEELMLLQSLRQQKLFSSPASSEKEDNLERSGPVDMRSFYQLQDGSDEAEDESLKMDLTFGLPNEQVVQKLLAADGGTAEVFCNHHYPYVYPGSEGVQDTSMMEDSVGTNKQNGFKFTPTAVPASVALCFDDTTAESYAVKSVGSIAAGVPNLQSLVDIAVPESKSNFIHEPQSEEVVATNKEELNMEGGFGRLEGLNRDFSLNMQPAASASPCLNDTQVELTMDMTDEFITAAVPGLQALLAIYGSESKTPSIFGDPLVQRGAANKAEALMEGDDNGTTQMSCDFTEKTTSVDSVAFGSDVPAAVSTPFRPDGTITAALPGLQSLVDIDDRSQETEDLFKPHRQLVGVNEEELQMRDGSDNTAELQLVDHTTNTGLNDDSTGRITFMEKDALCYDDTTANLILDGSNGFITAAVPDLQSLLDIDGSLSERKCLRKLQMPNVISKAENLPRTEGDKALSQLEQAASVSAKRQVSAVPVDTVGNNFFKPWTMEEKTSTLEKPSDCCVQSSKLVVDEGAPCNEIVQGTTDIYSALTGCKNATGSIEEQELLKETEGTGPPREQVCKIRNEDMAVFQGAIPLETNNIGTVRIDASAHQRQMDVQMDLIDTRQSKSVPGGIASPKQSDQADHTAGLTSGVSNLFNVQTNKAGFHASSSRSQGSPLAVRSLNFHGYQHALPDSLNTPLRGVSTVDNHQIEEPVIPEAITPVQVIPSKQTANCGEAASDFNRPSFLNCVNNRNVSPTAKVGSKVSTSTDETLDGNSSPPSQHTDGGDTLKEEHLPELTSGLGKLKTMLSIQKTRIDVIRTSEVDSRVVTKLWHSSHVQVESVYPVEEYGQTQRESEIPQSHKQSTEEENLETVQRACRLKGGAAVLGYWAAYGQQVVHDREKTRQDLLAKLSTFHRNEREEENLLTDMTRHMNLLSERWAATKNTLDQLKTKHLQPKNFQHQEDSNDKARLFEKAQARVRRKKLELDLLKDLDKKSEQDAHIEKEALFKEESKLRRLRNQLSVSTKFARRNGNRSLVSESGGRERDLEILVSLQTWTICSPQHHPRSGDSFEMVLNFEDCVKLRFVKRNRDAPVVLSMEVNTSALEKAYPSLEAGAMFSHGLSLIDHKGPLTSIPQAVQEADLHIGRALDLLKELKRCKSMFPHLALIRLVPPTAEETGTRAQLTFVDLAKNVKITSKVLMAPASMGGALFGCLKHSTEVKGGGLPKQRENLVKDLGAIKIAPGFLRMERLCQVMEDHICMI